MKHVVRGLILLTLVLVFNACENGGGTGDWATSVRGTVVDSVSGTPLADVEIYTYHKADTVLWRTSDSTGAFTFTSWGIWEENCLFVKTGYNQKVARLGTQATGGDVSGVEILLTP